MLLSKAIKLVAAFDHRDIFIDPDPDPAVSFAERQRLFDLPRSSWQNYDRSKISKGGGVYSRDEKYITLSAEAQKLFGRGTRNLAGRNYGGDRQSARGPPMVRRHRHLCAG